MHFFSKTIFRDTNTMLLFLNFKPHFCKPWVPSPLHSMHMELSELKLAKDLQICDPSQCITIQIIVTNC